MRLRHLSLVVLLTCAWTSAAYAAPLCPAAEVVDALIDAQPPLQLSRIEILLAAAKSWDTPPAGLDAAQQASWPTVRDQAIAALVECGGLTDATPDERAQHSRALRAVWAHADWEQTKLAATRLARPDDPVLAPVLAPGGGVPAPQPLQFGLSQVVSGGQPGMMASAMGNLDQNGTNGLWRHVSLAGSVLVLQPIQGAAAMDTTLPEPQLGAIDVGFLYSSKPTIYDWTDALTREKQLLAEDDQFSTDAWNVTDNLLEVLSTQWPNMKTAEERQKLIRDAVGVAGQAYFDSTDATLQSIVKDKLEELTRPVSSDFALRIRVSPDASFVPELPDLMSLDLAWSGEAGQARKPDGAYWRLTWSLDGDLSAFAVPQYRKISGNWDAFGDSLGGVVNASLGGVACLPTARQASPTRIDFASVARWSKHANDHEDSGLYSAGGHIGLTMPVGAGVSLVGTYTFRYEENTGWITITSFSFAKSVSED
jgi:hypothetical protein